MPFLSLPSEIQIEIFSYLLGSDLKAVRKVCCAFRDNAEPTLFRSVIATSRYQSLGAFQKIALFPVFQKHVREIVFDGSVYDQMLATREPYYHREADKHPNVDQGFSYHKHGRWKRYAQLYKEQEEMKSDGVLVQTISRALEWLPNVVRITYSPHPRHLPIEVKETQDLVPRGVTTSATSGSTCSDHPFRQLVAALYMSQFTGVRELSIETLDAKPGTEFALGVFDLDENEMVAAMFLFQHLEKLALSMAIWVQRQSLLGEISNKFATLLQNSTNLQYLHFHPTKSKSDTNTPHLFAHLGLQGTWPKLRSLSFECLLADEDELLGIISRHKKTLNSVKFKNCNLLKGAWANVVDEVVYGTTIVTFVLDRVNESILPHLDYSALSMAEKERWKFEGHLTVTQDGDRSFVEDNTTKKSVYDPRE